MPFSLPEYHTSLETLHVGCEKPHAYFIPYHSLEAALTDNRAASRYFKSLCGDWKFRWFPSFGDAASCADPDWPTDGMESLTVPMNWQAALGRGWDVPNYTNINYPYPVEPPLTPTENPCGLYVRDFTLPAAAAGKEAFLHFEGVDSCFYLWVNGAFAAYSQVSHMTSEINVTSFLRPGKNTL